MKKQRLKIRHYLNLSFGSLWGLLYAVSASASGTLNCAPQDRSRAFETGRQLTPILAALSPMAADDQQIQSEWSETGLYFEYLKLRVVNNEKCHADENAFAACLFALSATAQNAGEHDAPIRWVTGEFYAAHPELFEKALHTSDFGFLVKLKPIAGKELAEIVKHFNDIDRQIHDSYLKHYRDNRKPNEPVIDFDGLFDWTRERFVTPHPELEPDLTAATWNTYLKHKFDPHTRILPKNTVDKINTLGTTSAVGVGVQMLRNEAGVYLKPVLGSPAATAGVQEGDKLVSVDQKPVDQLMPEEISRIISGKEGEPVRVKLSRKGETIELDIPRGKLEHSEFRQQVIQDGQQRFGYLRLDHFPTDNSGCLAVRRALMDGSSSGINGYILDIRANPGGGMNEATCISSLFLGSGKVVSQFRDPELGLRTEEVTRNSKVTTAPLVVLVNGMSASASEILSGTMQEYGRGFIVGDQTFGKGTFQRIRQSNDFEKVGIAETGGLYSLASGRSPQLVGITPDFRALSKPGISVEPRASLREMDAGINPLPPQSANFVSPQADNIEKVRQCTQSSGQADSRYAKSAKDNPFTDYQLLVSQDILNCANQLKLSY